MKSGSRSILNLFSWSSFSPLLLPFSLACATTKHQEPAKEGMPNSLGVEEIGMPRKGGVLGRPREKEKGEEERAWAISKGERGLLVGCSRDFRRGLIKKAWGLNPIQSQNTSLTCIEFSNNLSYSTYIRNPIRHQLLEPLYPTKHTLFYTQGVPHMKSKGPIIIGHAQLDPIKVAPHNNYQEN